MIDKDEVFLKYLSEKVHTAFINGDITNTFRNELVDALAELETFL